MAQSLTTLRNSIITSIHGRRLGLNVDGYLVGPPDMKKEVVDLTSASTGTTISPHGVYQLYLTTLSTQVFQLPTPQPGVSVTFTLGAAQNGSTVISSAAYLKVASGHLIASSELSTGGAINLSSRSMVELTGLTTALWAITKRSLSSAATYNVATT